MTNGKTEVTIRRCQEQIWISKLTKLPCYDKIARKLVAGQTVSSVATWLAKLNPDGEMKGIGVETWRKYLTPLSIRIRREVPEVRKQVMQPPEQKAAVEKVKREIEAEVSNLPLSAAARKRLKEVEEVIKELDAEKMLKFAFVVQMNRVGYMIEKEEKDGKLSQYGHKEIGMLVSIASNLMKLEMGEEVLRVGRSFAHRGTPYGSMIDAQQAADATEITEINPPYMRYSRFDGVDEEAFKAAATQVIDEITKNYDLKYTKNGELRTDSGAESKSCERDGAPNKL